MSTQQQACPPGPIAQSPLNILTGDKFIMILNLPQALRKEAKYDSLLDIKYLEMSVFGSPIPEISVPAIDTRIMGQSVRFTSLSRPEYSPLNISFVIDNQFKNYYILWKWLALYNDPKISHYGGPNDTTNMLETEYQTTFSILGLNEYNNVSMEFQFFNAFVTKLGPISYDYKSSEQINCAAEFVFNQLIIKPTTKK